MNRRFVLAFGLAVAVLSITGCNKTQSEISLNNYNCLAAARSSAPVSANLESFVKQCRQAKLGPFSGIYADLASSDRVCVKGGRCDVSHELSQRGYIARWKSASAD